MRLHTFGSLIAAAGTVLFAACAGDRTEVPTVRPARAAGTAEAPPGSEAWVGRKAASFALPGIDGKTVDVGKALEKKPVVLVFYRGVW